MKQLKRKPLIVAVVALILAVPAVLGVAISDAAVGDNQFTLFKSTGSQTGTDYHNPPFVQPDNYNQPRNYADGRVYYRLEILDKPSSLLTYAQLCFWRHTPGKTDFKFETCTRTARDTFTDEGVYYIDAGVPAKDFWKKNGVYDWSKPADLTRFMLFDRASRKLLMSQKCGGACYPRNDLSSHVPIRYKAEVIFVAKNKNLDPPSEWEPDCPRAWSAQCGGSGGGGGTTTTTVQSTTTTTSGTTTTITVPPGTNGNIILLTNKGTVPGPDQPYVDAIEALGFNPVPMRDSDITQAVADAASAIIISSSVAPKDVPDFLANTATPIMVNEPFVTDDLGMAKKPKQVSNQRTLSFVGSHAIGGGLNGAEVVLNKRSIINVGEVSPDADVIAHRQGQSKQAAIYAYDAGDTMEGGVVAPAKRVGFFFGYPAPPLANDTGDTVFANALGWLLS